MTKDQISKIIDSDKDALNIWIIINKKYRRSKRWFVVINATIFFLTAALVLINLWAMLTFKDAPYDGPEWQWARNSFLSMAIISAFTGILSAILNIFKFKERASHSQEAIKIINQEYDDYKKQVGRYDNPTNNDQIFIEFVSEVAFFEF